MFYDALSRNTVKITLSESDMRRYSLKKEIITGRTDENKRSLTRFLKKFQSESAMLRGLSADRLFLEAFPSDEGGCVLYVSTLCEPERQEASPAAKKRIELLCSDMSLGDTVSLCAVLYPTFGGCPSRLLLCDGRYALLVSCDEQDKERLSRLMSEYGSVACSGEDAARAEEHGILIADGNAVRLMSGLA